MIHLRIFLFPAMVYILLWNLTGYAGDNAVAGATVESAFPGLASGILCHARLGRLPDSVLVRGDTIQVTKSELNQIIADGGALYSKETVETNAFFICEQRAEEEFLFSEAYPRLKYSIREASTMSRQDLTNRYLLTLSENEEVSEKELQDFYRSNKTVFGASSYVEVRDYIRKYLRDEKKQTKITKYIRTFGERKEIVVSASWAAKQADLAKQNPIDSARAAGKPLVVIFGGAGCCGPDKLTPVIDSVRVKYKDRVSVVYIDARKDPLLTARCNVNSMPSMIFYNARGEEATRLSGCRNTADIEQQLIKAGLQ